MFLPNARFKIIKKLHEKKYRYAYGQYILEGVKNVLESIEFNTHNISCVICTNDTLEILQQTIANKKIEASFELFLVSPSQFESLSSLKQPQYMLSVMHFSPLSFASHSPINFSFYLDGIQDPGNMGTIIRTCDWFGISALFLSDTCVDVYNSKVLQASMGSIYRVHCYTTSIEQLLQNSYNIVLADMQGIPIQEYTPMPKSVVVIGNEGNGISKTIETLGSTKITIPKFGNAESLNAAIAHSIICSKVLI